MKAYLFPGQGSQFAGMAKDLYHYSEESRQLFEQANEILGFRLTDIMFEGSEEDLKQTKVTQPAIFLHSVVLALLTPDFAPDMVAGHSLGEFSALVANRTLSFADGLRLVQVRANAMQKACELAPSTMAAILGTTDEVVEEACASIEEVVVAANFNSPGQVVISGTFKGVELACDKLKAAGAKRAVLLSVGGAFHSPLMEPARAQLAEAIEKTTFQTPICPIFQNVDAKPHLDTQQIKANLIAQLTAPVRWTQTITQMQQAGATDFIEVGPGNVLQGLVKKIYRQGNTSSLVLA
ncbi:ACP S-malonyltransferase [Hugenholtzia roseola]|uniref:ACP S-malonyltransferase n=1 Tax=Hugenholtzia roseola TaxID=1002 RepID=UPI00040F14DC|nr:ACP S-malonyltransferase [Hugenholtzia roseola]